ncbi:hypothetical protein C0583_03490 [Candidatus Parcubacteria bacterium]|nr:MAG: hypothetical protein C0583_03490 [Candidatus Parcubacteria bacterium]
MQIEYIGFESFRGVTQIAIQISIKEVDGLIEFAKSKEGLENFFTPCVRLIGEDQVAVGFHPTFFGRDNQAENNAKQLLEEFLKTRKLFIGDSYEQGGDINRD